MSLRVPYLLVASVVLLALLALVPHLPALNAGFVQDDYEFVVHNASLSSPAEALRAFDDPFPPNQPERGLYRPLTNFSYALDRALVGPGPRAAHAVNLLLYAGITLLVFALGRQLWGDGWAAFALAALFALHPVHSEAVDSVAGRSELLALLFVLCSLVIFARSSTLPAGAARRAGMLVSWLAFAAALLSKESAAMAVGWLLVGLVVFRAPAGDSSLRARLRALLPAAPYLALLPFYLFARFHALGRLRPETSVLDDLDLASRVWTVGRVFAEYLRLLVFPQPLYVDFYYQHSVGVQDGPSAGAWLGWSAALGLTAWLVSLGWKWLRGDSPPEKHTAIVAFGVAGGLLFLLPVSHLVPFEALMAERFLFAPSLGFAIAVVAIAAGGAPARLFSIEPRFALAVTVAVACVFAGLSFERSREWRDAVSLWAPVAVAIPDDPRVFTNLAGGHLRTGDTAAATKALNRALALDPNHRSALNNLAFIELEAGRRDEARELYRRVVTLDPEDHVAWNNLGVVETHGLNHSAAREFYSRALVANGNYATALRNLSESEANIARAERFIADHSPLESRAASLQTLRDYALACFVAGNRACAAESYASLMSRSGQDVRWRVPQLDDAGLTLGEASASMRVTGSD